MLLIFGSFLLKILFKFSNRSRYQVWKFLFFGETNKFHSDYYTVEMIAGSLYLR